MRNLRQAGDRGRLHGLREGLPQGMLQVLRLQRGPLHPEDPVQHGRQAQALLHEGLQRVRIFLERIRTRDFELLRSCLVLKRS